MLLLTHYISTVLFVYLDRLLYINHSRICSSDMHKKFFIPNVIYWPDITAV